MVSNIKRYKNTINLLKGGVLTTMKSRGGWGDRRFRRLVEFDKNKLYGVTVLMRFSIGFQEKIVCEEGLDGNIYIGPLIGKVRCMGCEKDHIESFIQRRAFSFGDVKRDMDISYEDYEKNPSLLKVSKPYVKIMSVVNDMLNGEFKITADLTEGEFPKLRNRNMLPVFIINTDKNRVEYFKDIFPETYRKDRGSLDLSHINSVNIRGFVNDDVCMPKGLTSIHIDSPYIEKLV